MTTNISRIYDQNLVNSISPVEGASQEFIDLLQKIVQHAGALLTVQQCTLALLDTTSVELVRLASLPVDGERPRRTRFHMNEGIAGRAAARRAPLVINDAGGEQPEYPQAGAVLCVPLIEHGRFIGVLTAISEHANAFDKQKVALLELFAEQAVAIISSARAAGQSSRKADQLEQLIHLSRDITTHLEPGTFYDSILSDVRNLISCDQVRIYHYSENAQELYSVAEWLSAQASGDDTEGADKTGVKQADAQHERICLNDTRSVAVWAALHRHPILRAPRKQCETGGAGGARDAHPTTSMAELAAPLLSKHRLYGVFVLRRAQPFSSEELRLVRHLSGIAAAALENMELFQQIHAEEEQLRAILVACSDGIALLDVNACLVAVNPAFARLFNVDPAQVVGLSCLELFTSAQEDEERQDQELALLRTALEQRQPFPYREIDLAIQGTIGTVEVSIAQVEAVGDRPDQALSLLVVRDVTAIRDANRTRARFLSMVTHELRSPLNAINGYLDLALAGVGGELSEALREFLQRARAGSEHLYALLEDLFLIARADAGQLRLNRAIVSLPDIIANAVEEQELTATDQGISITVDIPRDFPRLYADAGRLQQVLRNLLNNALRFTPAGGQVAICAKVEIQGHDAELDEDVSVLKLQVGDTGIGIAPEHQERIFERFYQVRDESGGRSGGQGLGLAIVKMIVELHSGHVSVESVVGQGSTFTCTLPCLLA